MQQTVNEAMRAGADNLLAGCVRAEPGDSLMLVREPPDESYYDSAVADCIASVARDRQLDVHDLTTGLIQGPDNAPDFLWRALESIDHVVFLARIGDQMRFYPLPGEGSKTMCYALDPFILGSEVCRTPYGLSQTILETLQNELDRMSSWRVTCPLGTDISGTTIPRKRTSTKRSDFTLRLFPDGPIRPIPCGTASGKIVTYLLPASATHRYEPYGLWLDEPVTIHVRDGRIVDISGSAARDVRQHYENVGALLGLDPWIIHSWHLGANPGVTYAGDAASDLERWNGVMHSHPRYAHFHTCGGQAPGEIANVLLDTTVTFDGKPYWEAGRLVFLDRPDIVAIRDRFEGCENAFVMNNRIGLDARS